MTQHSQPTPIMVYTNNRALSTFGTELAQCCVPMNVITDAKHAGGASTFYVTFFAAAFVFPAFAGLVRMSQEAHFLSDVVLGGVAMAMVVALVQLIFQTVENDSAPQRAGAAGTRTRL